VRFDFQEGLATTVKLLLDTSNVRAEGAGDIDFKDEFINIAVIPQAKRRRLIAFSTPFTVEGPLANPTVNVSSTGAATRIVGKTVVSPVNLLGSLVPFVNDRGKDTENHCLTLQDDEPSPTDAP
jgi:hypothetical protein